jgi:hypothetical protein
LFAILTIAMQSYIRTDEVPPEYQGTAPALIQLYRVRTAQCLTIANLTKPVRALLESGKSFPSYWTDRTQVDFMIETLYLYANIEYADERDGRFPFLTILFLTTQISKVIRAVQLFF